MPPAIEAQLHLVRKKRAEIICIQILDGQLPADLRAELSALGCEDEGEAEARVEEWLTRHELVAFCVRSWALSEVIYRKRFGASGRIAYQFVEGPPLEWVKRFCEMNQQGPGFEGPEHLFGADPTQQTEAEFAVRAARHWEARFRIASEMGMLRVTPDRELEKHCSWLFRNRVLGELYEKIGPHE